MAVFSRVFELQEYLENERKKGRTIGFVPTMGALHEGHLSLIRESKRRCDITVCSIFVNPTQFNDPDDLARYPVKNKSDRNMLQQAQCQVLFQPNLSEIYPNGTEKKPGYNFGRVAKILEAAYRPGHFEGMAQVVKRLLQIVRPDVLFMGQKDYQQQLIVSKLIERMRIKTKLVVCPTVREKDGLAMSSRNALLPAKHRKAAAEIYRVLKIVRQTARRNKGGVWDTLLCLIATDHFHHFHPDMKVEYFNIVNAANFKPINYRKNAPPQKRIALVALRIGNVRLIDNILID